jgi:hypothetical protein
MAFLPPASLLDLFHRWREDRTTAIEDDLIQLLVIQAELIDRVSSSKPDFVGPASIDHIMYLIVANRSGEQLHVAC